MACTFQLRNNVQVDRGSLEGLVYLLNHCRNNQGDRSLQDCSGPFADKNIWREDEIEGKDKGYVRYSCFRIEIVRPDARI